MKINPKTQLHDVWGNPLEGGKFTLGTAVVNALLAPPAQKDNVPGTQLVELHLLAMRVARAENEIDITPEEAVTMREKVAEAYQNPTVVGPVWALLG